LKVKIHAHRNPTFPIGLIKAEMFIYGVISFFLSRVCLLTIFNSSFPSLHICYNEYNDHYATRKLIKKS